MYEIWSLGHKPFEGFTNLQVSNSGFTVDSTVHNVLCLCEQCMQLVGSGFRLAPPPGCPRPLYELMIRCW